MEFFLRTKLRRGLSLAVAYTGLTLALTYPLILHFSTFFAGDSEDGASSVWAVWWMKYSLMDLHQSPLVCDYLFYPFGVSLTYHHMPKVMGLISIPFQYILGLTAAYNLLFVATFVATGLTTYWLVHRLTGERLPAFLAGAIFAFSPFRWGQQSHIALLSTMMIPVYFALLFQGMDTIVESGRRAWKYFVLAGVALAAAAYDTEQYVIFLLPLTALFALFFIPFRWDRGQFNRWFRLLAGLAVAGFTAALLYAPIFFSARAQMKSQGDFVSFPLGVSWPGADLLSFFVPEGTFVFLGSTFDKFSQSFSPAETTYFGWTAITLAVVGLVANVRSRKVWFWAVTAMIFSALALGPYPIINGNVLSIRGPYILITKIPYINQGRAPGRFALLAMLAIAVLAGYGARALFRQFKQDRQDKKGLAAASILCAVLLLVVCVEFKPSLTLTSNESPDVYREIASSGIQGSVIDLPLGWESGNLSTGDEKTFVQLYQPIHQRPMVGGFVSRAPKEAVMRGPYTPVIDYLVKPDQPEPSAPDKDPAAISRVMDEYRIAFIVVHKLGPEAIAQGAEKKVGTGLSSTAIANVDKYVTTYLGMEKFSETEDIVAYRRR